jgi:hypothetical protein
VDVAWDLELKDLAKHHHEQVEPDIARSCQKAARRGGGEATEATRPTMLPTVLHHLPAATTVQPQPSDSCHVL